MLAHAMYLSLESSERKSSKSPASTKHRQTIIHELTEGFIYMNIWVDLLNFGNESVLKARRDNQHCTVAEFKSDALERTGRGTQYASGRLYALQLHKVAFASMQHSYLHFEFIALYDIVSAKPSP